MDTDTPTPAGALLRQPEVRRRTGLPTSTLYRMIREGTFPPPVRIGTRAVAWPEEAVAAWIAGRMSRAA